MTFNRRPKTCCLVVGMHNSGTSLASALLFAAGAPMGSHLLLRDSIPEARRPRYDYYEDHEVVSLQDATLLKLKRHWSSYRSGFALPATEAPERDRFRAELKGLLQRRLKRERLWVVKDPRTATLLEDWLAVLNTLGIVPKLLIIHRDPTSNMRSFSRKGQVPLLWAEALWQRTYANALTAAQSLPADQVMLVNFQSLVNAPLEQAEQACRFLGWVPPHNLNERITARFDPSLPTETGCADSPVGLHPATLQLARLLSETTSLQPVPAESELLASEMAAAVTNPEAPLQLNDLHPDGQTLSPKLRVTIVTAELQGWNTSGGIGSAYLELALALAAAGHRVRLLLVAGGARQPPSLPGGIDLQHLDPAGLSQLEVCRRIADSLGHDPGDVIHLHDWLGLGSGLKAALGPDGPPLIVGLHGPSAWTRSGNPWPRTADGGLAPPVASLYAEGLMQALEQDLITHADLLVSPSSFMAEWVNRQLLHDTPGKPLVVQRNCPLSQHRLRAEAGRGTMSRCIYFGRLEQRKGLILFLDALEQMTSPPDEVIFLGGDCRISETNQGSGLAHDRLQTIGIRSEFFMHLQRSEALRMLGEIPGIVVIPSLIENSPCVVEELLDSDLKIVTTDVGGTRELVASCCEAWLCQPNPSSLAHHLQAALTTTDPLAYRLKARVPGWHIALSWQAFHERLPRRQAPSEESSTPRSLMRRSLSRVKRAIRTAIAQPDSQTAGPR